MRGRLRGGQSRPPLRVPYRTRSVGRDPCVPPRKGMWIPFASLREGGGSAKRWRRERFHTVFSPPVGCADSPLPEGASQRGTAALTGRRTPRAFVPLRSTAGSSLTPVYRRRSPQETGCAARRQYGAPRGGSPPRCSHGWSWRRCRCARRWSGRGSACRRARSSCSG